MQEIQMNERTHKCEYNPKYEMLCLQLSNNDLN